MTLDQYQMNTLRRVLDSYDDSGPIELTNDDALLVQGRPNDPALAVLFDDFQADIAKRNALIPQYEKAKDKSDRASSETNRLHREIRQLNERARRTRTAMEVVSRR